MSGMRQKVITDMRSGTMTDQETLWRGGFAARRESGEAIGDVDAPSPLALSLAISQAQSYKWLATPWLELTLPLHSVRVAGEWLNQMAVMECSLVMDKQRGRQLPRGTGRSDHRGAGTAACCARRPECTGASRETARLPPTHPVPAAKSRAIAPRVRVRRCKPRRR